MRGEERRLSAEYVGLLRGRGMQVIELGPEERKAWAAAASGIVDQFVGKHGEEARKLVDYMRAPGP